MTPLNAAEAHLTSIGIIDQPGAVLYSAESTLKPGPVYLLGLNPGGSGDATLRDSLERSRRGENAYTDEVWEQKRRSFPKGEAPLQLRVKGLIKKLGLDIQAVPASNLAFTRSTGIAEHSGFEGAVRLCAPVHRIFMDVIKPDFLMTFGNTDHFGDAIKIVSSECLDARHQGWQAKRGEAIAFGHKIKFGNVPHMSVWASDHRSDIVDWAIAGAK